MKLNVSLIRKAARAGQKGAVSAARRVIARKFGWADEAKEHVMVDDEPMTVAEAARLAEQTGDSEA